MTDPTAAESSPAGDYSIADVRVEWVVQFFPPDRPDTEIVYKSRDAEGRARARFAIEEERGSMPILMRRTVTTSDCEVIKNSALPGLGSEGV